jgi:hypothetical protein
MWTPTCFVKRPFGKPLEVSRCRTDYALVTDDQSCLKKHAGHYVAQPVVIKYWERISIWLRIIR